MQRKQIIKEHKDYMKKQEEVSNKEQVDTEDFFADDVCSDCKSIKKLHTIHPRLGWYQWICPRCNEKEYLRKWPTDETKAILDSLKKEVKEAEKRLSDFRKAYEKNPKRAVQNYNELVDCISRPE